MLFKEGDSLSVLYYGSLYKNKIINLLLKNPNFIKLINPTPSRYPEIDIVDVLIGGEWIINGKQVKEQGHIFDYNFVDNTTNDEKTFVFVETDIDTIRDDFFTDFNLYVCVFSEKRLIKITENSVPTLDEINNMYEIKNMGGHFNTYANRIDLLCNVIDDVLNGNSRIPGIGNIKHSPRGFCTPFLPNEKYYGKCLKYNITNLNKEDFNDCENQ